jgi:hypothetical protein
VRLAPFQHGETKLAPKCRSVVEAYVIAPSKMLLALCSCHALPFVTLSAVTCPKLNLQIEFGWTDKVTLKRADSQ